jgi:hypothetical protein
MALCSSTAGTPLLRPVHLLAKCCNSLLHNLMWCMCVWCGGQSGGCLSPLVLRQGVCNSYKQCCSCCWAWGLAQHMHRQICFTWWAHPWVSLCMLQPLLPMPWEGCGCLLPLAAGQWQSTATHHQPCAAMRGWWRALGMCCRRYMHGGLPCTAGVSTATCIRHLGTPMRGETPSKSTAPLAPLAHLHMPRVLFPSFFWWPKPPKTTGVTVPVCLPVQVKGTVYMIMSVWACLHARLAAVVVPAAPCLVLCGGLCTPASSSSSDGSSSGDSSWQQWRGSLQLLLLWARLWWESCARVACWQVLRWVASCVVVMAAKGWACLPVCSAFHTERVMSLELMRACVKVYVISWAGAQTTRAAHQARHTSQAICLQRPRLMVASSCCGTLAVRCPGVCSTIVGCVDNVPSASSVVPSPPCCTACWRFHVLGCCCVCLRDV